MDRADVTVVCCYNDPKQYKKLVEDLARQHYDYTLIGIDNCRQQYSSCAKALNAATVQVKTEYVIYSHQDIELPDADMLGNFVDYLFMTQKEDILGVAGAVEDDSKQAREHTCVLSKVRHGRKQAVAGEREYSGMAGCETVDECFRETSIDNHQLAVCLDRVLALVVAQSDSSISLQIHNHLARFCEFIACLLASRIEYDKQVCFCE